LALVLRLPGVPEMTVTVSALTTDPLSRRERGGRMQVLESKAI
jgi:hypothetical protein